MAADRAGMAARSMELAGFGGLVFGLGPAAAPLDTITICPSTAGFGPFAAPVFNIHVLSRYSRASLAYCCSYSRVWHCSTYLWPCFPGHFYLYTRGRQGVFWPVTGASN